MLGEFGRRVSRHWSWVIAVWAALIAVLFATAPPWDSVVKEGEFSFLPKNVPSLRAQRLLMSAFPDDAAKSSLVVLLEREGGLQERDFAFISNTLAPELKRITSSGADSRPPETPGSAPAMVMQVRTPGGRAEELLNSDDGEATLVVIELNTEFLHAHVRRFVGRVESVIQQLQTRGAVPRGLSVSLTGSAAVGEAYLQAKSDSADQIERWTRWLVIGLLIVVFRAPLAALIPLITLYCGIQVALKLLAIAARAGFLELFSGIEVYTTVLVYGAGVNYGMFLVARFQEELALGRDPGDAIAIAIDRVGTAVTASAGTGMFGIGMLALARFGKFHQAGITIAFGLFMMLCASLTLTPALLRLGGRWVFWPQSPRRPQTSSGHSWLKMLDGLWERMGTLVVRRPGWVALATIIALLPLAVYGLLRQNNLSYGLITELPETSPVVKATQQLKQHYPVGMTGPVTVLLQNETIDFSSREAVEAVETLTKRIGARQEKLKLADVRSVAWPLGLSEGTIQPDSPPRGYSAIVQQRLARQRAVEHYVSERKNSHVTMIDVVLDSEPLSRAAINQLDEIERGIHKAFPPELAGTQVFIDGITANTRDLRNVSEADRKFLMPLIGLAVLAVLIVLLRRIVLPVYLVLTVLLSFYVAFGTTFLAFGPLSGGNFRGLEWNVSLFLFAVLMAVGADYNVLLTSRVDEERRHAGIRRGTVAALRNTGTIISSCGIVMAGTFSSLMVGGTLSSMIQLGFALAFGIFLDTFVVRPLLVPAFLVFWYGRERHRHEPIIESFGSPGRGSVPGQS